MNTFRLLPVRMTGASQLILAALILGALVVFNSGCASKKKAAKTPVVPTVQQDDPEAVRKAKGQLLEILNDDGSIPLEEKEDMLRAIKAQRLQDPEVNHMIDLAEKKLSELRQKQQQPKEISPTEAEHIARSSLQETLDGFFDDLVSNVNYSQSDIFINQALKMFQSENVPVLIIISEAGGIVDYDEPTTIRKYLEYLDDTKNNANRIKNIVVNEQGLITELELIKK